MLIKDSIGGFCKSRCVCFTVLRKLCFNNCILSPLIPPAIPPLWKRDWSLKWAQFWLWTEPGRVPPFFFHQTESWWQIKLMLGVWNLPGPIYDFIWKPQRTHWFQESFILTWNSRSLIPHRAKLEKWIYMNPCKNKPAQLCTDWLLISSPASSLDTSQYIHLLCPLRPLKHWQPTKHKLMFPSIQDITEFFKNHHKKSLRHSTSAIAIYFMQKCGEGSGGNIDFKSEYFPEEFSAVTQCQISPIISKDLCPILSPGSQTTGEFEHGAMVEANASKQYWIKGRMWLSSIIPEMLARITAQVETC